MNVFILHLCLTLRYYGRECYDSVKNDLSSVGSRPCEKRKRWRYRGCLLCHVSVYMSLHPHSASPGFTPTLICGAADPLLFCHPDMFNKHCLAGTGYIRGVVVGLHRRWWIIRDSRLGLINVLEHSNTGTPTHSVRRRTSSPFSTIFFVYIFAAFFLTLFVSGDFPYFFLFFFSSSYSFTRRPERLSAGMETASEDSPFNRSTQKQQNTPV